MKTVIYDACVLYPASLRDFLMWLALEKFFQARWTDEISQEWIRNLNASDPERFPLEKLERTRAAMEGAIEDAVVTEYEKIVPALSLPDPNDRHVLAAAILAEASIIVTENVKDFPADELKKFNIEAMTSNEFVIWCLDNEPHKVHQAIANMAAIKRNPPITAKELMERLISLDPGIKAFQSLLDN